MVKMAVLAMLMALMVFSLMMETAIGAVYAVGDSAGWTIIGNVDYKGWAATKTFEVGDTIVFTYNKQFHNVMQVKHADYRSCNVSAPIATHSTGNDSIIIKSYGHHFYLCAFPGHCQAGQKLDINVERLAQSPSASDTPSSTSLPSPSTSPTSAMANKPSSVAEATSSTISLIKGGLVVAMFFGIV
ncbi:hypothetical protein R6Q57_019420 [Mikania cordata]